MRMSCRRSGQRAMAHARTRLAAMMTLSGSPPACCSELVVSVCVRARVLSACVLVRRANKRVRISLPAHRSGGLGQRAEQRARPQRSNSVTLPQFTWLLDIVTYQAHSPTQTGSPLENAKGEEFVALTNRSAEATSCSPQATHLLYCRASRVSPRRTSRNH